MITPADFASLLNPIWIVLMLCVLIGGFFAVRNGRQTSLAKFQEDTNKALKDRIAVLESKIADFEKENVIQRHVMETITSALKQRGMIITVDGDMVTIQDRTGTSTHRKRSAPPAAGTAKKEPEEK